MRKSATQKQRERQELLRYSNPFGNVGPDVSKLLVIYARQSSTRQFVENVYSSEQQRDGLLKYAKDTLHWQGPIKLLIENDLAKHTSGTLPTDSRPGLLTVLEYVESREGSAVLAVDVSRLFRDETALEAAVFAETCKDNKVSIITLSDFFDFNNPKRFDRSRFIAEAMEQGKWIKKHIHDKMLPGRLLKAEKGYVANGIAPIGLRLVQVGSKERDVTLTASPHAPYLAALYKRFYELGADLSTLHNEIVGKPIFPELPDIDPSTIRLTKVPGGWTVKNRSALRHILTNPAYVGHLQFNGEIVKRDAWKPIVSQALWDFADSHLSKHDLNGIEYDRPERTARYVRKQSEDYGALLFGVRPNGEPVIDGVGGQHVYVQIGKQYESVKGKKVKTEDRRAGYVIKDHSQMDTSYYVASMAVHELDTILESYLLAMLKSDHDTFADSLYFMSCLSVAVDRVEGEQPSMPKSKLERDIEETAKALARIDRQFNLTQDIMTDAEYRQNRIDSAKLTKRLDDLNRQQKQEELTAESLQQAQEDVLTAHEKWHKWPIDRKRRLIHILTESITLECIADGWLKLTIDWHIPSKTTTTYMWRDSVRHWSTQEKDTLRALYPSATRDELLHALPQRSWQSIRDKACEFKFPRQRKGTHSLPDYMTITDMRIAQEYSLDVSNGQRLWWVEESSNGDGRS
jgi:Resolvase, N terminal domain/Recombinase